jgi:hypothetical protein
MTHQEDKDTNKKAAQTLKVIKGLFAKRKFFSPVVAHRLVDRAASFH